MILSETDQIPSYEIRQYLTTFLLILPDYSHKILIKLSKIVLETKICSKNDLLITPSFVSHHAIAHPNDVNLQIWQ